MNQVDKEKATLIFAKQSKDWTRDDELFLNKLFDKGHREELKKLRATLSG